MWFLVVSSLWNAICFKIAVVSGALQINLGGAMNEARGAVNVWRGDKFFWWGDNFLGGGVISCVNLSLPHKNYLTTRSITSWWR